MNDLSFTDPCVIFALRRESQAFRREFRPHQRFPGAPCWARFCGPPWLTVLVLETGLGAKRMEAAVDWLLGGPLLGNVAYRPKVVISAGFSGALREGLAVGDLVLATEVADSRGNLWPATWPGELPPGEWRPPLRRGRLLTTPHLVASAEEKHALSQRHEAMAVDMETAVVARRCQEQGVPSGCLRAISDDAATSLSPRLASLLSGGRVSTLRLMAGLVRSPGMLAELFRLARQTRGAGEQLGKALGELLTLTLPWAAEL